MYRTRRPHVCAHTCLSPHDFAHTIVPRHVCAQTRLCPHTCVPRHICGLSCYNRVPDTFLELWHVIIKLQNIPVGILPVNAEQKLNNHISLFFRQQQLSMLVFSLMKLQHNLVDTIIIILLLSKDMIVSGHNSWWGTNVSGHKRAWPQSCKSCWHNHVWAHTCLGTTVCGHKRGWAQACLSTNFLTDVLTSYCTYSMFYFLVGCWKSIEDICGWSQKGQWGMLSAFGGHIWVQTFRSLASLRSCGKERNFCEMEPVGESIFNTLLKIAGDISLMLYEDCLTMIVGIL